MYISIDNINIENMHIVVNELSFTSYSTSNIMINSVTIGIPIKVIVLSNNIFYPPFYYIPDNNITNISNIIDIIPSNDVDILLTLMNMSNSIDINSDINNINTTNITINSTAINFINIIFIFLLY